MGSRGSLSLYITLVSIESSLNFGKVTFFFHKSCFNQGSTTGRLALVVYFILIKLLYLAFSANLGLLCMPHPGMGPLV